MGGSVITFSHLFFYLICLGAAAPALPVLAGIFLVLTTLNTAKLCRFLSKKKLQINRDNIVKVSKAGLVLFAAGWLSYLLVLGVAAATAYFGPIGLGISIAILGAIALTFAYQHKEYIKDNAISFLKSSFAWFISVGFFLGSGFAFSVKALQLLPALSITVPLTVNPIIFITIVGTIFAKQLICDILYHVFCAAYEVIKGEELWPDERKSHAALAKEGLLNIIMTSGLLLGLLVKLFIPFIIGFGVAASIPFWVPIIAPIVALLGLAIKLYKYHQEHHENSWLTLPNILIASGITLGFEAGVYIPFVIGTA